MKITRLRKNGRVSGLSTGKKCAALLGALGVATTCMALPAKADPPGGTAGWTLSFEDNFDGTTLNTSKWNASNAPDGTGMQTHLAANNVVGNGILSQLITKTSDNHLYNCEVNTRDKFEAVYAYFEARSKTPTGTAIWPSFWTVSRFGWPPELDIYENWSGSNGPMTSQNWHYRNASGGEQGDAFGHWLPQSDPDYWTGWGAKYHTYAALWEEGKISFYVDGVLTFTTTKEVTTLPMYLIMSNGIGHGSPDLNDTFDDRYTQKVDYVRVWTKPLGTKLNRAGWSASASASGQWWPASNAIDSDVNSKWTTGVSQTNGQSFTLNLGSSRTFDTAELRCWGSTGDAPVALSVYVSDDGVNWGSALGSKSNTVNIQDLNTAIFKFAAQNKQYVRFVQTGTGGSWWSIEDANLYTAGTTSALADGTYKIVNKNSNKALTVSGNSTANGANIVQWTYSGANSQRWTFASLGGGYYSIRNVNSGQYMDIQGASKADGAWNIQWPWNNGWNQYWLVESVGTGEYRITNRNSGKVLDISGQSTADGGQDIQWPWNSGNNQRWLISAP